MALPAFAWSPQIHAQRRSRSAWDHCRWVTLRLRSPVASEKRDAAWKEAEALFEWHYGVVRRWGAEGQHTSKVSPAKSFRDSAGDRYVIGTPDEAIKAIERVERELGVNFVIVRLSYVGMSFEEKLRQIRLFGEGVVPHFKKKR